MPPIPSPVGQDMLSGNPPPAAQGPMSYSQLAPKGAMPPGGPAMGGGPPGPPGMDAAMTGGMSQIGEASVRMAMEIDQALKVLAQQVPQLLPWVAKTSMELKQQLGEALNAGAIPTSPMPAGRDAQMMPDGSGRL